MAAERTMEQMLEKQVKMWLKRKRATLYRVARKNAKYSVPFAICTIQERTFICTFVANPKKVPPSGEIYIWPPVLSIVIS